MELDLFGIILRKIDKNIRTCFLTGFFVGILAHLYMLTNKFPNWDDMNNLNWFGAGDNIGRWMLKYIHTMGNAHSIPSVHGVIMILFLALSACLVISTLELKTVTAAIITPICMVTFHAVACTMTFMFTAHSYGVAIFLLCLSVFLMKKNRWYWFVIGGVLLILSLGIYQSYISIAITLMLMTIITLVMKRERTSVIIGLGTKYLITLGISTFVYIRLSHIIYPDLGNESYAGVGNMGQLKLAEIPIMIARCYKRFLEFFVWNPFAYMSKTMQVTNIMICFFIGLLLVWVIIKKKIYKSWINTLIVVISAMLVPYAASFVYFMAPDAPFSMLMLYSYSLIPVYLILLLDEWISFYNSKFQKNKEDTIERLCVSRVFLVRLLTALISICILLNCYTNYLISNTAYMRMQISYERVSSYFNRILTGVELTDGYRTGEPVTILGEFYYVDNPSPVDIGADFLTDELREMSGVALENGLITSGVRDNFIENYIGFDMADIDFQTKEEIRNSEEYHNMPCYPQCGSIQKIDGIWVVKLCD